MSIVLNSDPPWFYVKKGLQGCIDGKKGIIYPMMTEAELCVVVPPAAPESIMFMWATMPQWPSCMAVLKAWDFTYAGVEIIWLKCNAGDARAWGGIGALTASNVELLVVGTRGERFKHARGAGRLMRANRVVAHSGKPDMVYDHILAFCHLHKLGRPLEMFARCTTRPGWDFGVGDQQDLYAGLSPGDYAATARTYRVSGPALPNGKKRRDDDPIRLKRFVAETTTSSCGAYPDTDASEYDGDGEQSQPSQDFEATPQLPSAPAAGAPRNRKRRRPYAETLEAKRKREAAKHAEFQLRCDARTFPVVAPSERDVVFNQKCEYAVVLMLGCPSGRDISRLDIANGMFDNGLLVIEATPHTLNDAILSVNALPLFRYQSLLFVAYDIADPQAVLLYIVAARDLPRVRVRFYKRAFLKQTLDMSGGVFHDPVARRERVIAAIDALTNGARAAILELEPSGAHTRVVYTITELGGGV